VTVTIERVRYSSQEFGVTYLAIYGGRAYSCLLPTDELEFKSEGPAVEEFERRIEEIHRATENTLASSAEKPSPWIVVRLGSAP